MLAADFAFFSVLAVDIAALLKGFRRRFCGLMTIDDQVAMDSLFLLPKVKVEFRHLFSLQKRFSLCSYHNINANIVVFC
jgi:hypothetical protein